MKALKSLLLLIALINVSNAQLVLRCNNVNSELWTSGDVELWEGIGLKVIDFDEDPGGGVIQGFDTKGLHVISSQGLVYWPNDPVNYTIRAQATPGSYVNANWTDNPTTAELSSFANYNNIAFASYLANPIYKAVANSRALAVGRSHWNIRDTIPHPKITISGYLTLEADAPSKEANFDPHYFLYCALGGSYLEAEWDGVDGLYQDWSTKTTYLPKYHNIKIVLRCNYHGLYNKQYSKVQDLYWMLALMDLSITQGLLRQPLIRMDVIYNLKIPQQVQKPK